MRSRGAAAVAPRRPAAPWTLRMRIVFRIHYLTAPGYRLEVLAGDRAEPLAWDARGWWTGAAEVEAGTPYRYRIVAAGQAVLEESGPPRTVPEAGAGVLVDRWRPPDPTRRARHSAIFSRALASVQGAPVPEPSPTGGADGKAPDGACTFRLHEPDIPPGARPAILGSDPSLGEWDPGRAVPLAPDPYPQWSATVELTRPGDGAAYKYVLLDRTGGVARWEDGDDRGLPPLEGPAVVTDDELRGRPGWRGAGVAVPVFSLRTRRSLGVGQFRDLVPFADWAAGLGFSVIQILPVNDTTKEHRWGDSYPYDVVSVHALHPLYIDIESIAGSEQLAEEIAGHRRELEAEPELAYERVMEVKWSLLRRLWESGPRHAQDPGLDAFLESEWDWLGPYAMWCLLRDRHGTPDPEAWGPDRRFDPARLTRMAAPGSEDRDELRFHGWVQLELARQLGDAVSHARRRGVALKGDLPIGVSPTSVEVWTQPELFHVGTQSGAPPDAFAARGQNWGFPTYDWERMAGDGYAWWRRRFEGMARRVDAFRIDHILGFFRIWEIPPDVVDGLLGHFRPCLPLRPDELRERLGVSDLEPLLRPAADTARLVELFGPHAELVRERFFEGPADDLRLREEAGTQRRIVEALDRGALGDLDDREQAAIRRGLLDLACDVLLLPVEGGYHPRISWQETEAWRRLPAPLRAAFDAVATDFYYRRHDAQWEQRGRTTLPAVIDATDLLACGEDLGMVPDMVPRVMRELGILSLEIERMPKTLGDWRADPAAVPYLSVVSPGTHDMSPLRLWWEEDREAARRLWHEALGREGSVPATMDAGLATRILRTHLESPAMLCILPVQDVLATSPELARFDPAEERINVPADRHHRWRYRLHVTTDELHEAASHREVWARMVRSSGRWRRGPRS